MWKVSHDIFNSLVNLDLVDVAGQLFRVVDSNDKMICLNLCEKSEDHQMLAAAERLASTPDVEVVEES